VEAPRRLYSEPTSRPMSTVRTVCQPCPSCSSLIDTTVVKRSPAMQNFAMRKDADGRYTRTLQQDLARAELLQLSFPNSTAAQELAAHKRRTALIAQMHKQAVAAADHVSAWQRTLKARIDRDARRRKVTIWLFAGNASIVALACVVALLWS
jgi:hypothetical protein